ncbi:MAG: phosphoglycolate phosphatase [Ectothiorhodospiraceae bacterium]|nr:phosphoglycolate phosphatase [Ectothiorhodospiraceae bacterium]MCH8504504.1 phosphoglycolate phosphatase [Ectothiorhodospiraceae bacterium]
MRGVNTLLFDLDGTLIDSAPDLADAVDRMLEQLGRAPAGEAQVRRWVGNGAQKLVMRALTGDMHGDPDPELTQRALALFLESYRRQLSLRSRLYPGVREGLDRLLADGYRLACVTNKPEALARPLLEELGLGCDLPVIVGGDTTAEKKPSALPLQFAMGRLGSTTSNTMMVGDSRNDVEAARNAGVPVVCVPYGYNHGGDIREAAPDAVVNDFLALHHLLRSAA